MATFSDLNFLMITFFVLLLSMSSMDQRRYADVFGDVIAESDESLRPEPQMGRGPLPGIVPAKGSWVGFARTTPADDTAGMSGRTKHKKLGAGFQQETHDPLSPSDRSLDRDRLLRRLMEKTRDIMAVEELSDREIRLAVDDAVFFEDGAYRPSPQGRQVLEVVAELALEFSGELQVQAHRGDWELAARQSAEVARLVEGLRVPGARISADVITGPPGVMNFALTRNNTPSKQEQRHGE
jgi:flagellar motor protein MotB